MNILLIQTDQQRRDSLGAYGNAIAQTPAIGGLAEEGVVFDYAFTPAPLCAPARASLITGKRASRHGILFNAESGSVAGRDFRGEHATLAQVLHQRGYRSTICGKWHVGSSLAPGECGFEGVFYPGYGYPDEHPHYLAYLDGLGTAFALRECMHSSRPGGGRGPLLAAIQDGPEEVSVPHYLVNQAIEAIRESAAGGNPFFVSVNFWGPHAPYILPKRHARMYDPDAIPPWPNFADSLADKPEIQRVMRGYWGIQDFTWRDWSPLVAMCYGYVSLIDEQIARLLAALEDEGLSGETAVFLIADHGGMVGAHGLADKGPYLYDEVVRVPLIARVPGVAGGRRSDALVYTFDLMPTIIELAGCDPPSDLDACSLGPLLRGERDTVRDDEAVFIECHGHQTPYPQRMVRTRSAKYVFNAAETDELYDLRSDPGELTNVVGDSARNDLLRDMRSHMQRHLVRTDDPILRFFEGTRLTHAP